MKSKLRPIAVQRFFGPQEQQMRPIEATVPAQQYASADESPMRGKTCARK